MDALALHSGWERTRRVCVLALARNQVVSRTKSRHETLELGLRVIVELIYD